MGKRIVSGINDLYTWCTEQGEYGDTFIKQWTGITETGEIIDIHRTAPKSPKRVLFQCVENSEHKWYAKISGRNSVKSSCPYCAKEKGRMKMSLLDWCNANGDFGEQFKSEWVGVDEKGNNIHIDKVSPGSAIRAKFQCKKGHTWIAKVAGRTYYKSGCPKCNHENRSKVGEERSLNTWCSNNGNFGEMVRNEWVGLDTKGNKLDIYEIAASSNKRAMWKCSEGHTWEAVISSRTHSKSMCPYCSNKRASDNNNLLSWCKEHDIPGKLLIEEWTGVDEDGNRIDMTELLPGSSRRVKWECKRHHTWYSTVHDRTRRLHMCPKCSNTGTSFTEQLIYFTLKELYSNCENRYRAFKGDADLVGNFKSLGVEYDIALLDDNIFIEYSPSCTHIGKTDIDRMKMQKCLDNNIRFIYIGDNYIYDTLTSKYTEIEDISHDSMIKTLLNVLGKSEEEIRKINIHSIKKQVIYKMYC